MQFDNLYLLIGVFRPITLNVITDMVWFKSIILQLVFCIIVLCSIFFSAFFGTNGVFLWLNFISFVGFLAVTLWALFQGIL